MAKNRYRKKDKTGTANLIINNERRVVRAGEIIECEDWEIPEQFMDTWELISRRGAKPVEEKEPDDAIPVDSFRVKHVGGGRYDVISKLSGKPINDERLNRAEAYALAGIEDPMAKND